MKIEKKLIEIPIELFKDLVIEPCIEINEGIKIVTPNEANCVMCIFELPKEKFIEYNFEGVQKFKVAMDLFNNVLKRIKTKNININYENEKLIISDEQNKKSYEIAAMVDEDTQREVPELPITTSFKMKSAKLQEILGDASIVSTECTLETKENLLIINAGNLNKHTSETECETESMGVIGLSLEYLLLFMNASKYFKEVLFEFSTNSPCKLTFENEDLKIQFILAARVE